MAPLVDYDDHQHHVYRQARELPASSVAKRMAWFRRHVGDIAPEPILDLGCGTGRFAAPLAATFDTTVIGVEPSLGMLHQARGAVDDDRVVLAAGRAEALPLLDSAVAAAFALNVLHHVDDRPAAARELDRVVASGGVLVVFGSVVADYAQEFMSRWFPSYPRVASEVLPTISQLRQEMTAGDWQLAAHEQLEQPLAHNLAEYAERIALRGQSLLELLPDAEFHSGVESMRTEVHQTQPAPVIGYFDCFLFTRESSTI